MHFGYIYGVALLGCVSVYVILNLMSNANIDIYRVASVLGYSLLPIVLLSFLGSFVGLKGWLGIILSGVQLLIGCCFVVC